MVHILPGRPTGKPDQMSPIRAADTINADLSYFTNGQHQTNVWESMASFRGVSEGDVVRYSLKRKEPLAAEHEAFRDAVRGGGTNIVTMREGLHTVRAVEAVLESARKNRFIDLTESRCRTSQLDRTQIRRFLRGERSLRLHRG